jgi:two-component sensor histidine kinase
MLNSALCPANLQAQNDCRLGDIAAGVRVFHLTGLTLGRMKRSEIFLKNASNCADLAEDSRGVIEGALSPYRTGEGRFSISGPAIVLGPKHAVALAMAVHEFGTKAIKYGALSNNNGRVDISWDNSPKFQFRWHEKGGPPVERPSRTGFVPRLINRVLGSDFGGEVELCL